MTTWLITGCSSGLGRALADSHPRTAPAVVLDVTDAAQVTAAVEQAIDGSAAATCWSTTPATATARRSRKATTPTCGSCSRRTSSDRSR